MHPQTDVEMMILACLLLLTVVPASHDKVVLRHIVNVNAAAMLSGDGPRMQHGHLPLDEFRC
jgi:hypothetical protein